MRPTNKKQSTFDPIAEARKYKNFQKHADAAEVRIRLAVEIYNARKALKLSQQELAKKVKSTQKVISNIENGETNIRIDLLNRLSKALNFTADNFGKSFNCCVAIPDLRLKKHPTTQTLTHNQQDIAFEMRGQKN